MRRTGMMSFENEPKRHKQQILLWMYVEKGGKTSFETNPNEPSRTQTEFGRLMQAL
jgi:hypothetical protein